MRTQNYVPLSLQCRGDSTLVYFDINQIEEANIIEKAYIIVKVNKYESSGSKIQCGLNDFMTAREWEGIQSCYCNTKYSPNKNYLEYIDITEDFHLLVSEVIKNNGFIIKQKQSYLKYGELYLKYRNEIIIPDSCNSIFYERELILSSVRGNAISPWILTKLSKVISFYIKNISNHDITLNLQNSPNAIDFIDDAQKITIAPKETGLIIPYAFSKYTRIQVFSPSPSIAAIVWFQTQIISQ